MVKQLELIGKGKLKEMLVMETHGGRARSIETGDLKIDLAIIATPCVDKDGNGTGKEGEKRLWSIGICYSRFALCQKCCIGI